jgi:transcriptional regulator with XRE-family HTH domain
VTDEQHSLETHVGQRIKAVRSRRGMKQGDLAAALRAAGGVPGSPEVVDKQMREREPAALSRTTIAKIESGARGVSLNELVALAAVLNVSPTNLMLPDDEAAAVRIVGDRTAQAWLVRSWIHGVGPLDPEDDREYFEAAPTYEYRRGVTWRSPAGQALRDLERTVLAALAGTDGAVTQGVLAASMTAALERVTQTVDELRRQLEEDPDARLDQIARHERPR